MKVVINRCYGGFGLSTAAYDWLIKNKGWTVTEYSNDGRGYKDENAELVNHGAWTKKEYPNWGSEVSEANKYVHTDKLDERTIRSSPDIIEVVEKLKEKANGNCAKLGIIEIPDDLGDNWEIGEYDGNEWVQEVHRRWD